MIRILVCFVTLFLSVVPVKARTVELMLSPAKAPEPVKKYHLLPKADEQTDSDALPLYREAVESLPQDLQRDKINEWLKTPPKDLPVEQVESRLRQFSPTLQLLRQASLSKKCSWPAVDPVPASNELTVDLSKYRQLAFILAVQARLEIAQGGYDQAVATVKTGFVMARHLGQAPTLIHGLVGVAIGALMCGQLEELVQARDAPNLYWALENLPKPFIDVNRQIQIELDNLKKYENPTLRKQFEEQSRPAHERVRVIARRLDRDIAALQCVEALRLYAANHNGKFPNELTDVTEVALPNDPFTQKPFVYSRTGSRAVLEGTAPEGGTAKDAIRYVLNLKE